MQAGGCRRQGSLGVARDTHGSISAADLGLQIPLLKNPGVQAPGPPPQTTQASELPNTPSLPSRRTQATGLLPPPSLTGPGPLLENPGVWVLAPQLPYPMLALGLGCLRALREPARAPDCSPSPQPRPCLQVPRGPPFADRPPGSSPRSCDSSQHSALAAEAEARDKSRHPGPPNTG